MSLNGYGLQGVVLRLPASLRARAATLANQESLSLNLFIAAALAEKINRLEQQGGGQLHLHDSTASSSQPENALLVQ
jgi:hypothetical protein